MHYMGTHTGREVVAHAGGFELLPEQVDLREQQRLVHLVTVGWFEPTCEGAHNPRRPGPLGAQGARCIAIRGD